MDAYARLRKPGVILGRKTLDHYRYTRNRTKLPSHVKPPPKLLGNASHGKLSADEWNTVCLYMLPFTLVSMWGFKSSESREGRLLENTMHLTATIRLATLRRTTPEIGERLADHYRTYLQGLLDLFPHATLKPSHHMFSHTPDFLGLWGSSRNWSAWVFEFLNGLSQMIRHNWKDGK